MDVKLYNRVDQIFDNKNVTIRIFKELNTYHVIVIKNEFGKNNIDGTYGFVPTGEVLVDVKGESHDEVIGRIVKAITKNTQQQEKHIETSIKAINYKPSANFNNINGMVDVNVTMTLKMAVEPTTGNTYINENELLAEIYEWLTKVSAMNTRMQTPLGTTVQIYELIENGIKVPPVKIERV